MDLTSIVSGSDNLWKYLFTLGSFMFVLAIVYPLQKRQEIEIEINQFNKEAALLNSEIKSLKNEVLVFPKLAEQSVKQIDSLESLLKRSNPNEDNRPIKGSLELLRKTFNDHDKELKIARQQIETKSIASTYDKSRIKLLQRHLKEFAAYTNYLICLGIFFALIGLVFWAMLTIKKDFSKPQK